MVIARRSKTGPNLLSILYAPGVHIGLTTHNECSGSRGSETRVRYHHQAGLCAAAGGARYPDAVGIYFGTAAEVV